MRLNGIRNLVAVVESGSIRAAARKLGVSQPAITKSVRSLETELHLQLLKRTPQGVVPTPAGRALLVRARAIQAELRKAQEEMSLLAGRDAGSVTFGVGPMAAVFILPEAIREFRQQFPNAHVRIVEGFAPALISQMRDESLDFALGPRFDTSLGPSIKFRPLLRLQFGVVARKGHPLAGAHSLAELREADWLSVEGIGMPGGLLNRTFGGAGLPLPRQAVQCDSINTMVSVLSKTDMLGVLGTRVLAIPSVRELLVCIKVRDAMPSGTIGMFMRADPPLTRVAAAMAKTVTAVARRLARQA